MKEIWKDIMGYEGAFQVSNLGNVRAVKGKKVLSFIETQPGYLEVKLFYHYSRQRFRVHRLVAETFIPNPMDLTIVNHRDNNKHNNRVDNLEWCTQAYNVVYSKRDLKDKTDFKEWSKHNFVSLDGGVPQNTIKARQKRQMELKSKIKEIAEKEAQEKRTEELKRRLNYIDYFIKIRKGLLPKEAIQKKMKEKDKILNELIQNENLRNSSV